MKTTRCIISILTFTLAAAGCGEQKTLRDAVNTQNDSFAQSRYEEMAPAEGTYKGVMHMSGGINSPDSGGTGQDFPCVLEIKRKREPKQNTQLQDQSETVEIIKLEGGLRFPFLEKLVKENDYADFDDLLSALGGFSGFNFDFGNYNPRTHLMVIHYEVKHEPYGDLSGNLVNGKYTGTWFVNPIGDVATFEFTQQATRGGH